MRVHGYNTQFFQNQNRVERVSCKYPFLVHPNGGKDGSDAVFNLNRAYISIPNIPDLNSRYDNVWKAR